MRAAERQHWSRRDFRSATLSKFPYCVEIPVSINVFKHVLFACCPEYCFLKQGSSGNQLIVMSQRARTESVPPPSYTKKHFFFFLCLVINQIQHRAKIQDFSRRLPNRGLNMQYFERKKSCVLLKHLENKQEGFFYFFFLSEGLFNSLKKKTALDPYQ